MSKICTIQPIFSEKELDQLTELIGPDTLLFNYQKARIKKDWKKAEELQGIANIMGFSLSFEVDCYVAYEKEESNNLIDSLIGRLSQKNKERVDNLYEKKEEN